VRWVQSSLNMVMNLRLPVNGIMDPQTRSAIRDFQRREGLPEDGIAGPETKAALMAARRGSSDQEAPPATNGQNGQEQFLGDVWNWLSSSQGQVDRNSHDYIQWVQRSLNKIIGSGLVIDGIRGQKTRSAIRDFQGRYGLDVDGDVGSNTEKALIAAGAGRPPRTSTLTGTMPAAGNNALRKKIVQLANKEYQRWQRGRIKEGDPRIRKVLEDYWQSGVKWLPDDPAWWSNFAWSAAFISWIMRKAGAGSDFKYSAAHAVYTTEAKKNRLAGNQNPFKAYRVNEAAPRPGDLVCKSRDGSGATYDNIRQGMKTHCDIVTEVQPGRLTTIGGNVRDSVYRTDVNTDANGRITEPGYFAVIKIGSSSS
jgi:hypothetical protein